MAAKAQDPVQKNPSTLRTKQIIISSDSVFLDSLSIVPNTFFIQNVPDSFYFATVSVKEFFYFIYQGFIAN